MNEPVEVRLARIEEGMVRIHDRIGSNHQEIMSSLNPVLQKTAKHHDDIVVLKRDRFWLFTLAGTALSAAGYAILQFITKA